MTAKDKQVDLNGLEVQVQTITIGGTKPGAPGTVTIDGTELGVLDGVTAGTVTASKAVVVDSNKHIDTISIAASGLKIGSGAGTAVTATAAELNTVAGVTAGTVAASKAIVVDTNKHIDTLGIAASGLKIGTSGSETAVTATGAELNTVAGVTAGTVAASKAVVVDTNKHIDTIGIAASGLKIGASGSETAVTATGAELNTVAGVTAGTLTASKAVVVDSSSNIDVMGIKNLKMGATPVAQVDPASCTITAAAGAANHCTITVQLKDGSGTNMTRVTPFKVYLATDNTGLTLQSAASTGYSVSSGGVKDPTGSTTITQGIAAFSSASGGCVIDLLDTGKGTGNLILMLPTGFKASAAITSGSYG